MTIIREGGTSEISTQNKSDGHITLAVLTFIALIGLIVTLITYKLDDIIIKFIIIILPFILIFGFWGEPINKKIKNNLKQRKLDKLSKVHFINFKKLVLRFEKFIVPYSTNIYQTIVEIKQNHDTFSNIHIPESTFFTNLYEQYKIPLNQFNGTKVSLVALGKEFDNILRMYNQLCINEPIKEIRNIGSDKVQDHNKRKYNHSREEYINFLDSYKNFATDANKDFEAKDFKDYFDSPDEL